MTDKPQEEILYQGVGITRLIFVAETSARVLLPLSTATWVGNDAAKVKAACDLAEALWTELCARFPNDETEEPNDWPRNMVADTDEKGKVP